jgi:hypothetical protein
MSARRAGGGIKLSVVRREPVYELEPGSALDLSSRPQILNYEQESNL